MSKVEIEAYQDSTMQDFFQKAEPKKGRGEEYRSPYNSYTEVDTQLWEAYEAAQRTFDYLHNQLRESFH